MTEQGRWYITFGTGHLPGINNYVVMSGMTIGEAIGFIKYMVGNKYAFIYSQKDWEARVKFNYGETQPPLLTFTRRDLPGELHER